MNFEGIIALALLGFALVREWAHHRQVHALLEKLMSRDLYDFKVAQKVGTVEKSNQPVYHEEDTSLQEDLKTLNGIL